jgi:predicted nucleotidyltransferase
MEDPKVREQFETALELFVNKAKEDKEVLGIILFGSLAYNYVHERSNINVMVVVKEGRSSYKRLVENGVSIDAGVYNINEFRRRIFGRQRVAYHQSLSRSKLLFSRDGAIDDLYNSIGEKISGQDQAVMRTLYHSATVYDLSKAEKYLFIKNDIEQSFWWTIHALSEMGYLMCYMNGIFPPREVILEAKRLYPDYYQPMYDKLVNNEVTKELLIGTITEAHRFLDEHTLTNFKPVLDFISNHNGTATQVDVNTHFRPKGLYFTEFEYLHRKRVLRRTIASKRLTKKGRIEYPVAQYHFDWEMFDQEEVIPTRVGPTNVDRELIHKDYQEALNSLAARAKEDEYMLSFMVCGSLSYDTVWEKSDLDVMMITSDDKYSTYQGLLEKDVSIDGAVYTRDEFRKGYQRVTDGSILHSYFSKSKLIFTKDETIHDMYEDLERIGSKDLEQILLINYVYARDLINKTLRALYVHEDPTYSINFLMSAIRRVANIEVLLAKQIPLRESIVQALEINPKFFKAVFTKTIHKPIKDENVLSDIIRKLEQYLQEKLPIIVQPLIRLIEKEDEITYSDIWTYMGTVRIPVDLRDFVKNGLLNEIQSQIRFARKSSAELTQPAYALAKSEDDIMMDIDI